MLQKICIFLITITITSLSLKAETLVIWDIGQGSSASIIDKKLCFHFDLGGEKSPLNQIRKFCRNKKNIVIISHFDFDHYNFLKAAKNYFPFCIYDYPTTFSSKYNWIKSYPACVKQYPYLKKIFSGEKSKNKNSSSLVYLYRGLILFPGDSLKKQEEYWSKQLPKSLRWIISPHHGSKTSNSKKLLEFARNSIFLISSRQKKYGHPHRKVTDNLKTFKIPYLTTDDWGSIFINF